MSKWTPIKEGLPGRSTTNPNHSRTVLTCLYLKPNDTPEQISQSKNYYESWMREAYYDFTKSKWHNDVLGQYGDIITATHWMELPANDDPAWVSSADRMPPPSAETPRNSPIVLAVTIQGAERIPVTSSIFNFTEGAWKFFIDNNSPKGPVIADRDASAWMPLPAVPDQY